MRSTFYGAFSSFWGVDTEDFLGKFEDYESIQEFFTRPVKPRTWDLSERKLVSPADSKILSVAEVKEDSVFLVKGRTYSFSELVTGIQQQSAKSPDFLEKLKNNK